MVQNKIGETACWQKMREFSHSRVDWWFDRPGTIAAWLLFYVVAVIGLAAYLTKLGCGG